MAYAKQSLAPDETLLHLGALHWIVHAGPIALLVVALVPIVVALGMMSTGNMATPIGVILMALGGIVGLIGLIQLIGSVVRQMTTDIAVTSKKVVSKWGWISRRTIEQRLEKIDSVEVVQSLLGRVLGYGTIIIHGSGATMMPIQHVRNPVQFRQQVEKAIEASADSRGR